MDYLGYVCFEEMFSALFCVFIDDYENVIVCTLLRIQISENRKHKVTF